MVNGAMKDPATPHNPPQRCQEAQTDTKFPKLMTHSRSWEFLGPIASNLQTVLAQFLFSFFFSHTGHRSSSSDVLQQPEREEAGSFNEKFPGES